MKRILIFIILFIFIGCGSGKNSTSSLNNNYIRQQNVAGEVTENETSDIIENNITQAQVESNRTGENNLTLNSIKNILASEYEFSNIGSNSDDEILDYIEHNSDYSISTSDTNDKDEILSYIKHNSDYSISPLIQKLNIDKKSIKVFYDLNKSLKIPTKDIYVLKKNDGGDSKIFLTFNAGEKYNKIIEAPVLIFYHNTIKFPTGFTNINANRTTRESLLKEIENAFKQVGINNLEIIVDNKNIKYTTSEKNDGKVFQCKVDKIPETVTIVLKDSGSTPLNYPISSDINVSCKLEDTNNTFYLANILKQMQGDFNIEENIIENEEIDEEESEANISANGINDIITSPTPVATSTPIVPVNSCKGKFKVHIKNERSQKNELNVTVVMDIYDDNLTSDKVEIRLRIKNDEGYEFFSQPELAGEMGRYEVIDKDEIYLSIDNVPAERYTFTRYEYAFEITNLNTSEMCIIEGDHLMKVYGHGK